jgi:hypothetical protein
MSLGRNMRYIFRRHLFLLFGLLTLGLCCLVAALGDTELAHALAGPMRILIVPM